MSESERDVIKKLATSEPVVRNLILLWDLYMNANHTGIEAPNMTEWESFLEENRDFVESFDFLKDLAIDNPGKESFAIFLSYWETIVKSYVSERFLERLFYT